MAGMEGTLWILAVILLFGLIIPEFFKRLQLPFASLLILVGAVIGPSGFDYVQTDQSLEFFGYLGAAFLMLLAGLEAKLEDFEHVRKPIFRIAAWNSLLPFTIGTGIAWAFDYEWPVALLTGVMFMTSSVILVFGSVRHLNLDQEPVGKVLKGVVALEDLLSLISLSLLLVFLDKESRFPLPIYLGLLISSIVILRMFLPEVVIYFFNRYEKEEGDDEKQTRLVIGLLFLVVVLYSAIRVHPVVAAFLVGFTLSNLREAEALKKKLYTIGYSLFVPVFFFVVGMRMDLRVLGEFEHASFFMVALIVGAMLSKFLTGFIAARGEKFGRRTALFFGVATTTKITTTLSIAYTGFLLELIDTRLLTAMVIMVLLSTLLSPNLAGFILKKNVSQS